MLIIFASENKQLITNSLGDGSANNQAEPFFHVQQIANYMQKGRSDLTPHGTLG